MHQRRITLEQFADIFPQLIALQQIDTGPWLVTVGRHPILGCTMAVQDLASDLMLFSEQALERLQTPHIGAFMIERSARVANDL